MNIIIIGAGEVGYYLSELLSNQGHAVTVIESNPDRALRVDEDLDVRVVRGNGSTAGILMDAHVSTCDFFLAMTSDDRVNLISCSLAKKICQKVSTVARIHDQIYADNSLINYQLHFGIDNLLNPEALSAVELAKEIRNPGRVAVENFARGQIEVQQVRVSNRSKLIGKTLKEIRLDPRLRIGYLQRNERVELPTADSKIENADLITLFGHPEALFEARPRFDPASKVESVRVVLFGGTETAIALIRLLSNPRFKIRVIEKDRQTCQDLAERFPHVTIIHGDGTSLRLLEQEQIGAADYFIACTKRDEDNIMTCLQTNKLGTSHVQLLLNKSDYQKVLENLKQTLGVEMVVSPRLATANEVLRSISTKPSIELASLQDGLARILEIRISQSSPGIGKKIRDLQLPPGSVILALLHKYQAKVPGAEDILLAGDRVVAVVREERQKSLLESLV